MTRRRTPYQSPLTENEEQRMARLDREAIRTYSTQRYAGGGVSKRYRREQQDAPDALQVSQPKEPK